MSRFLLKILLVIMPVLFIALAFESLVNYRLKSGSRFYFQNDWHDFKGHNSDAVFVGNSRIWVQVNPFYIDSAFNIHTENIAQDGQAIDILWYKFREYARQNKPPKEIYVLADPFFWELKPDLYGLQNYRLYFFMNRIDMRFLHGKIGYKWYYSFIPMSAYDKTTLYKIIMNDTVKDSYEATRGFIPQDVPFVVIRRSWYNPKKLNITIDPEMVRYVDSFYSYSKTNNSKLYFFFPPVSWPLYSNAKGLGSFDSLITAKNEMFDYPAVMLDYNDSLLYDDSNYFYNHMHINKKGVDIFMHQFTADTNAFTSFR